MPTATVGQKVGARKVDAESYLPDPGDWQETNVIYDFGDGWLICEDRTEYDRRLMAHLTMTCVASLIRNCIPFDSEGFKRTMQAKLRAMHDTPRNAEWFEQNQATQKQKSYMDWLDTRVANDLKVQSQAQTKPMYKLLHLRDPAGRPRCCILLGLSEVLDDPKKLREFGGNYATSRDLGKQEAIQLDHRGFYVLEFRIGTGKSAPKIAEEYVVRWYRDTIQNWNEGAYQQALDKRIHWEAYKGDLNQQQIVAMRLA